MLSIDEYIDKGRVKRGKIAMDIKYGIISETDLDALVSDDRIRNAFIGSSYEDKIPRSQWSLKYLDELSYSVSSEGFNEDYLRYLFRVAKTVREEKGKNRGRYRLFSVIFISVIVILILVIAMRRFE